MASVCSILLPIECGEMSAHACISSTQHHHRLLTLSAEYTSVTDQVLPSGVGRCTDLAWPEVEVALPSTPAARHALPQLSSPSSSARSGHTCQAYQNRQDKWQQQFYIGCGHV